MDAAEAKAIADRKTAERSVVGLLNAIKERAGDGGYAIGFVRMSNQEIEALRLLGFIAEVQADRQVLVSWK